MVLRSRLLAFGLALLLLVASAGLILAWRWQVREDDEIVLATTTSVRDSGLLEALLPGFERQYGYRVSVIAVGSGAALALGARGEADLLLTHAPDAEREWMAQGYGRERLLLMVNDFLVVCPPDLAPRLAGKDAVTALATVAGEGLPWVSRDDGSGTAQREAALWQAAGIDPSGARRTTTGQGMGQTLVMADQLGACTLSDRGTWLAYRSRLGLQPAVEGDPRLRNLYHLLLVDPARFPGVNAEGARALAGYLLSPEVQARIATFRRDELGEPLFQPAAGQREEDLAP